MNYRPYDDFIRLLFFHAHLDREESALTNELEESDQFRLLRATGVYQQNGYQLRVINQLLIRGLSFQ
jgi:hypothetical protein